MIVVQAVMPTDSATSPFDREVMTLDDVPPGQQPTRITPTASSVGSWNMRHKTHARKGMMMNCEKMPVMTAFGFVNTTLKSESLSVMPIPNITMPSNGLTQLVGRIVWVGPGIIRAMTVTANAMNAMYFPAKSLILSSVFISNFLS